MGNRKMCHYVKKINVFVIQKRLIYNIKFKIYLKGNSNSDEIPHIDEAVLYFCCRHCGENLVNPTLLERWEGPKGKS